MENTVQWDELSARNFYLEQLKIVRAEADKLSDESRVTERYVLGGCGAIYTFVLVHRAQGNSWEYLLILLIPMILAIWGAIRSRALYLRIVQCAQFVRAAECVFSISGWVGWEHWLTAPGRDEHVLANSAKIIWWSLIVGTALIATATIVAKIFFAHCYRSAT